MRYLTLDEVLELHRLITEQFGGSSELRDPKALDAAVSAPHATFSGNDLYPGVVEKAAVLCFLLIANHPFLDGNKRVGHAAMETFLRLNGYELNAPVDDQEEVILKVASGHLSRAEFLQWVRSVVGRGRP